MSSFWWNLHHWLHRKLSKRQLSVQPVMKISSKWQHFRFSVVQFVCVRQLLDCFTNCLWIKMIILYYSKGNGLLQPKLARQNIPKEFFSQIKPDIHFYNSNTVKVSSPNHNPDEPHVVSLHSSIWSHDGVWKLFKTTTLTSPCSSSCPMGTPMCQLRYFKYKCKFVNYMTDNLFSDVTPSKDPGDHYRDCCPDALSKSKYWKWFKD